MSLLCFRESLSQTCTMLLKLLAKNDLCRKRIQLSSLITNLTKVWFFFIATGLGSLSEHDHARSYLSSLTPRDLIAAAMPIRIVLELSPKRYMPSL